MTYFGITRRYNTQRIGENGMSKTVPLGFTIPVRSAGGERSIEEKFRAKRAAWQKSPAILNTSHRIIRGDARELVEIPDGTAHLIVTSPPYWNLKKYRPHKDQLGHIDDYQVFHEELTKVWRDCFRVLCPGGRLCIVVGDVCRSRRVHGRHQVIPLHADFLTHCRPLGFEPLAPIIWYKIANAVTEVAGNGSPFLGKPYEPNAIIKNDIEYILMLRKPGYRRPTQEQRDLSLIEREDHSRWFRQIWDDLPGASQRDHPAPFPEALAHRLISMFSFVGDLVVDPFLGTGTTAVAAMKSHRSSIGIELDTHYFELARKRFRERGLDKELFRCSISFESRQKPGSA